MLQPLNFDPDFPLVLKAKFRNVAYVERSWLSMTKDQRIHFPCSGLPTQEDRLILALGLGGSGNDYRPVGVPAPPRILLRPNPPPGSFHGIMQATDPPRNPRTKRQSSSRCPQHGTNGRICHNLPGKYSFMIFQ